MSRWLTIGAILIVALSIAMDGQVLLRIRVVAAPPSGGSDDPHGASPVTLPTAWANAHTATHATAFTPSLPTGCTTIDVGEALPAECVIITVDAGQDLQTALNTAAGRTGATSDIIRIEKFSTSSAVFAGSFRMPARSGTGWTYIMTSGTVTDPGDRVNPILGGTPGDIGALPIGVTGNTALGEFAIVQAAGSPQHYALDAAQATFNWRWIGIHFRPAASTYASALIRTYEDGETDEPTTHHIIFDRVFVQGDSVEGANVCMSIAGRRGSGDSHHAIIDSYIANCFRKDAEAKGVLFTSTTVAALINSYVESSGISIYVDMSEATYNPTDIEVAGNFFSKPIAWNTDATFVTNKNCFEVKSGVRVLYHGNFCQNVWVEAQETAINIKIGDELSAKLTTDITIRYSIIRNSSNAVKMCTHYCNADTGNTGGNFALYNNLFYNIDGAEFGGDNEGHGMMLLHMIPGQDLYIVSHNTSINEGPCVGLVQTRPGTTGTLVWNDNICNSPVDWSRFTDAEATTVWGAGDYAYTRNLIIDTEAACVSVYPAGNQCPADYTAVTFENFAGDDYRIAAASPYKGDGQDAYDVGTTDPGANIPNVLAATECAITGQCAA